MAARIPGEASSITRQLCGRTSSFSAAFRYTSGSGFPLLHSSPADTTAFIYGRMLTAINELIFRNDWVKGNVLAERVNVTPRTIRSDISAINHLLHPIGCGIQSSKKDGYKLSGDNVEKLSQILSDGADIPNTPRDRIKMPSIRLLMADSENVEMTLSPDLNSRLTRSIVELVKEEFNITFNEAEQIDLMIQISLMRLIGKEETDCQDVKTGTNHYEYIVDELLNDIKKNFFIDLTEDYELKQGLVAHIQYMMKKRESSLLNMRKPILY